MAFVIVESCTKDEKCIEVCPVDCIHPRKDEPQFAEATQLYVDPVNCIDCGACVPVCEASAILPQRTRNTTNSRARPHDLPRDAPARIPGAALPELLRLRLSGASSSFC